MRRSLAFSFLEILVIVAIISVLAMFGHQTYVSYNERAKVTEAINVLEEYQSIALGLRARNGAMQPYYVLFTDADQTGLVSGSPNGTSASKQVALKNVTLVTADSGTSGANNYLLLGAQIAHDGTIIDGADFVYIAGVETPSGLLTWQCGISASKGDTINQDYLPTTCRASLP